MIKVFASLVFTTSSVVAQSDGNPHNWDRLRRCDHTDYDPPCGVCEGYGGIPYGDENDEITLTSCVAISNVSDVPNPVKPVWDNSWKVDPYFEVLIGKKTDPFCFSVIPSNDSVGELCYRPDYGAQYYDVGGDSRALRFNLNSLTPVGNITSKIIHQDTNFWIVNDIPIGKRINMIQCICSTVQEGGDASKELMYPVNPTWTDQMFYIGREDIGIEYTDTTMVLEHFAFGPHHLWSHPETGEIIRMWQPFNGLQVFPAGTYKAGEQDQTIFESPPPECVKEGGAKFRISCTDDGFPEPEEEVEVSPIMEKDIIRAKTKVPRDEFKGDSFTHMSQTLNGWLQKGGASTRACDDWSTEDLHQLQAVLYLAREAKLEAIYQDVNDNRKMRKQFEEIEADWAALTTSMVDLDDDHVAHNIRRDGHCHEAVMWYVHHLTAEVKETLAAAGIVIPLLSLVRHAPPGPGAHAAHVAAHGVYEEQVTCSSCHAQL